MEGCVDPLVSVWSAAIWIRIEWGDIDMEKER